MISTISRGILFWGLIATTQASHFLLANPGVVCRGSSAPPSPGTGWLVGGGGAGVGEWYWTDQNIGQSECAEKCRNLARWNSGMGGCKHFSYGGAAGKNCYVHLECLHQDVEATYNSFDKHEGTARLPLHCSVHTQRACYCA